MDNPGHYDEYPELTRAMTTPSVPPIALAGEPIDMALLAEQQAAFEKWWPEWQHLCPDRAGACVAFVAGMDAAPSPSASSVPVANSDEWQKGYVAGRLDFESKVAAIAAPPANAQADETVKKARHESYVQGWKEGREALAANPAPSVLTKLVDTYFNNNCGENLFNRMTEARALLQANGATK